MAVKTKVDEVALKVDIVFLHFPVNFAEQHRIGRDKIDPTRQQLQCSVQHMKNSFAIRVVCPVVKSVIAGGVIFWIPDIPVPSLAHATKGRGLYKICHGITNLCFVKIFVRFVY